IVEALATPVHDVGGREGPGAVVLRVEPPDLILIGRREDEGSGLLGVLRLNSTIGLSPLRNGDRVDRIVGAVLRRTQWDVDEREMVRAAERERSGLAHGERSVGANVDPDVDVAEVIRLRRGAARRTEDKKGSTNRNGKPPRCASHGMDGRWV